MQKKKSQKEGAINSLPLILNSATLTELLNISRETLSNWQSHPFWPKDAKTAYGKYDLKKVLDWRDIYIIGDPDIAKQMAREKLKYQIARSERERLETEELQKLLVRKERYNQKLREIIVVVKDALLLLPKTIPFALPLDHASQKLVVFGLDKEIKRILRIWASGIEATQKFTEENRQK